MSWYEVFRILAAGAAQPTDFNYLMAWRETMNLRDVLQRLIQWGGDCFLNMAAYFANEEHDALLIRMPMWAGDEGVEALKPMDKAVFLEEIQCAVDGDGRKGAAFLGAQGFDQIIGTARMRTFGQSFEHGPTLLGEAKPLRTAQSICRS